MKEKNTKERRTGPKKEIRQRNRKDRAGAKERNKGRKNFRFTGIESDARKSQIRLRKEEGKRLQGTSKQGTNWGKMTDSPQKTKRNT